MSRAAPIMAILLLLAAVATAQDLQELYHQTVRSVVIVHNPITRGQGSGVVVASMRILTAKHITDGARKVLVRTHEGRTHHATVLRELKHHDLALLRIENDRARLPLIGPPVEINVSELRPGQSLFLIGHPAPLFWALSLASVMTPEQMSTRIDGGSEWIVYIQCVALPGYSGAPAFDLSGRLVATAATITVNPFPIESGGKKNLIHAHAPLGGVVPIHYACRKLIDCGPEK